MSTKSRSKPKPDQPDELDRIARSLTPAQMRPLGPKDKLLWQWAKRGRGRPRKPANQRAVAVQITVDPMLLQHVDSLADQTGKSRSQLIAEALRAQLRRRKKAS